MEYTSLTPVSKIQINQPSERPLDRPTLVRPQRTSTVLINEGGGGGNNCAGNSNSAPVQVVDPFLMMQRQMSTPTMMDPNMMLQLQVNIKKPKINRIGSLTFYFFRPRKPFLIILTFSVKILAVFRRDISLILYIISNSFEIDVYYGKSLRLALLQI